MSNFLPDDYKKIPTSGGNYMRLKDGANTFRVLSSAIIGWEYWTEDKKPVRAKERWLTMPKNIRIEDDGSYKIKHFWAFAVWNCQDKAVQILELTQATIMRGVKALVDNPKWGDPKNYDITITRTGEGFETEYHVAGDPPLGPTDSQILAAYKQKPVNLEALYDGDDPFAAESMRITVDKYDEEIKKIGNSIK